MPPPCITRDAAKSGRAGSIGVQSDGSPVRIEIAPGNRTAAICGEPAIVIFDSGGVRVAGVGCAPGRIGAVAPAR